MNKTIKTISGATLAFGAVAAAATAANAATIVAGDPAQYVGTDVVVSAGDYLTNGKTGDDIRYFIAPNYDAGVKTTALTLKSGKVTLKDGELYVEGSLVLGDEYAESVTLSGRFAGKNNNYDYTKITLAAGSTLTVTKDSVLLSSVDVEVKEGAKIIVDGDYRQGAGTKVFGDGEIEIVATATYNAAAKDYTFERSARLTSVTVDTTGAAGIKKVTIKGTNLGAEGKQDWTLDNAVNPTKVNLDNTNITFTVQNLLTDKDFNTTNGDVRGFAGIDNKVTTIAKLFKDQNFKLASGGGYTFFEIYLNEVDKADGAILTLTDAAGVKHYYVEADLNKAITENATIYAYYVQDVDWTVYFQTSDGDKTVTTERKVKNPFTTLGDFTAKAAEGFEFAGWALKGTSKVLDSKTIVEDGKTYVAMFTEEKTGEKTPEGGKDPEAGVTDTNKKPTVPDTAGSFTAEASASTSNIAVIVTAIVSVFTAAGAAIAKAVKRH